jgi:hypothetical protein
MTKLREAIDARLRAGETLTLPEIERLVLSDPAAATAFAALAEDLRAGKPLSIEDVSKRTGLPVALIEACEMVRLTGGELAAIRIDHGSTVH